MSVRNSWQSCFFSVRIIHLKLNISCENMSGYQYRSYFYIKHGIINTVYRERSYNLNDVPVYVVTCPVL
jgi:hypothetical protein